MGGVISVIITAMASLFFTRPTRPPTSVTHPPPSSQKTKQQLISEARAKLGIDVVNNFNFAIAGQSGSGKSSLINALMGMSDHAEGSAPVGEVETTHKIQSYSVRDHPHIVLFDLPGAGTAAHPKETYFEDKALFAFDCLIVVTANRFMDSEILVAKTAAEWGVPVFFVRSKCDESLQAKARRCKPGTDVKTLLRNEVTEDISSQLVKAGLGDRKIYIISAWDMADNKGTMDESSLVKDVISTACRGRNGTL